jgi:hypothetical protein
METAEAASTVSYRSPKPLLRSDIDRGSGFGGLRDRGILNKISTTLLIHRKVVLCTKLHLKKFCFRGLIETAESFVTPRNIGSQFLERDTIAKTNTYVNIAYLQL